MKNITALVLTLSVLFPAAAFADVIEGRVVRADSRALDVTVYDPQGRPYPNTLRVAVDNQTRKNGFSSFSYLRPNDPIAADVRQTENRVWRADSVTLFQNVNVQPKTQNPPPTMRDVLGNPVVRGALVGAATGAIASSASGGKAGKGALVGAGVGAGVGLLENLFSGGGQQQQPQQTYADDQYR